MKRIDESMMDARMGTEAIMTRIGAVLLPLGVILFVVATAIFHPHREDPMDNPAVFMEYAQNNSWVAIHFAQWVAALLLIGGLVSLYYSLTTKPGVATDVSRFGLAAAVVTATAFTMLQAVDGVALKWAVDTWADAPAEQQVATFAAAQAVRWTEYALQSYSNILLGLTLMLYALAMALGASYPGWLGWLAAGSGVAWIVHGVMVPYVGFFDSIPRLVAIVLLAVWAFIIAVLMWRNSSRGYTVRLEAAPQ
ncbi:MAG: hypothetical protein BroJett011_13910 [Chloroflexota bacterium]|nr:MAG: hypothetical protein BroJett011_13910 [Chloroflexota bacterium]